jgi:hypothetical protein
MAFPLSGLVLPGIRPAYKEIGPIIPGPDEEWSPKDFITPNGYTILPMILKKEPIPYNPKNYNTSSRMTKCYKLELDDPGIYEGVGAVGGAGAAKKTYYLQLRMPDVSEDEKETIRQCIYSKILILRSEDIPTAPDGVYTYILCEKGFFANMTKSILEIGTVHAQLAHRVGANHIYVAGEFKLSTDATGRHIVYNTLSGTYMLAHKSKKAAEDTIKGVFAKLQEKGITANYLDVTKPTLIYDFTPITLSELKELQTCGLDISFYNSFKICQFIASIHEKLQYNNRKDIVFLFNELKKYPVAVSVKENIDKMISIAETEVDIDKFKNIVYEFLNSFKQNVPAFNIRGGGKSSGTRRKKRTKSRRRQKKA